MGKGWDHGVPGVDFWTHALRVAKPGAHLLAFGGTRTYHRLACAIEDAGWEIRDCVMWMYGSGFPKSHDVSKAIDKMDAAQQQQERRYRFTAWVRSTGVMARQIDEATGTNMGGHYTTAASQPAIMTREHLEACRHLFGDVPEWVEREADIRTVESKTFAEREVVGIGKGVISNGEGRYNWHAEGTEGQGGTYNITAPATEAARQWNGWGTALKPAYEPIIVARKPLDGTVAENVIAHGTGAMNVGGCRVEGNRWPANLIHDDSDEVLELFPTTASNSAARFFYCAKASKSDRDEGCDELPSKQIGTYAQDEWSRQHMGNTPDARREARHNTHPTVKPTALMRYLCRLVTPPNGIVLDPFSGSGSTGKAAILEGFRFVGIEQDETYATIARARIEHAMKSRGEA
jgi:hypothetical protein